MENQVPPNPVVPQDPEKSSFVQIPETLPVEVKKEVASMIPQKKNTRIIIIAAIAVIVFLLGILGSVAFIAGQFKKSVSTPTPTPLSSQQVLESEIKNPSRYATDAGVLKIKDDLDSLDKDLNTVDLNENTLRPPDIQFDESF